MKRRSVMRNRAGTTLIETLIALTLLGALITATLSLMDSEIRAFNAGTSQIDALQNVRFTMSVLEKDLATVGTNIGPNQPFMVYADSHVVVFNADYASSVENDPFAVYVDTAASNLITTVVPRQRRFILPRTSTAYPDSTYRVGGANSPAETITFYFEPDTSTTRTDDYRLYRKVNDQPSDVIARNLLRLPGNQPFFQYTRRIEPLSGAAYIEVIPQNQLPLRHQRVFHGAPNDTGTFAAIDRIRAVKVNFRVTNMHPTRERIYSASRTIWFPNAGQNMKQTCGDEPIFGNSTPTRWSTTYNGLPAIELNWPRAVDEAGGERDVIRYVVYRQTSPGPVGDPFLSIPAGQTSYTYHDTDITPGVLYYYSIAAQDCTPTLSDVISLAPISWP